MKPSQRPKVTRPSAQQLHECPGGSHDPVQRAVADALEELGLTGRAVGVAPVGCALLLFESLDIDIVTVPPGRGPAVAAGIKRVHPQAVVFSLQGGWDAAAAGTGEVLHAAARAEPITLVDLDLAEPAALDLAALLAAVPGAALVDRFVLGGEESLPGLRARLARAFTLQRDGSGFGYIQITSRENAAATGRKSGCLREPSSA